MSKDKKEQQNEVTKAMEETNAKTRQETFAVLTELFKHKNDDFRLGSVDKTESKVKQEGDEIEKIAIAIDYLADLCKQVVEYGGNLNSFLASLRSQSSGKPVPYFSNEEQLDITKEVLEKNGLDKDSVLSAYDPYYRR